ncbi:RrF2 family transcriptional regulator [Cohnella zeiphila]|uniref:Rrf2 family transcriptional regulator n=1 Tax=Cohnella zeiphila TaxID=2761120 RepID=A0A7X0SN95_9BACL|nr:Rrf2 family transcriptional regulator [Cohnella zeiphila]MBB6733036.1 Rrf2 family transcriptional regulator [Cohnella zeiphila]
MNSEFIIAVHSLVFMAYRPDGMASSEEIAANVCTHPARIRKVLGCLRKEGFVATREGSGGGYRLVRDPASVTLADVYRAMAAGTLTPSWCSGDPDMDCMVGSNMQEVMNAVFCGAETRLESYFSEITIGSMLNRIKERQQV